MPVTGMELLLIGAGVAKGKEQLKKLVESIQDVATDKTKKFLRDLKTERQISRLYSQIGKVRKVKTLGQLDKAVDLMSFYCDSHIYTENKRKKITRISDFGVDENILIEGIAGQGKSIFLRYLCGVELVLGDYIPIFVELRKISEKQSLLSLVVQALKSYHLNVTEEIFAELAGTGRLLLLLDAFDEVADGAKQDLLREIEQLANEQENLRILITSRPESGIAACPLFHVVKLSDLKNDEYMNVIRKISPDLELAHRLISQIKAHKGGIQQLLHTPLLVTLLVIRFKSFQELPEQLSDFYDSLFQVLLQRHDGLKAGYKRPRRCTLNDIQYRQVFEAFCFILKGDNQKRLNEMSVYKAVEKSLRERHIKADSQAFTADIVEVTCLLVKDGEEYRFIHKSVQEYYAACFIKEKPDVVVKKLYARLFSYREAEIFKQELRFLAEIDKYRYYKYGVLPYLMKVFSVSEKAFHGAPEPIHISVIRERINNLGAGFSFSPAKKFCGGLQIPMFGPLTWTVQKPFEEHVVEPVFSSHLPEGVQPSDIQQSLVESGNFGAQIKLVKLVKVLEKNEASPVDIEKASEEIAKKLFEFGKVALDCIAREEREDSFLMLD